MMWDRESTDTADKKDSNQDTQYAIHNLQRLSSFVYEFRDALQDDRWRAVNSRRLLIYGDAGVGKSHLFGDAVEHWIDRGKPALPILGSAFTDGISKPPRRWALLSRSLRLAAPTRRSNSPTIFCDA
jgi:chromosomal replication initiation ATPase DnaA